MKSSLCCNVIRYRARRTGSGLTARDEYVLRDAGPVVGSVELAVQPAVDGSSRVPVEALAALVVHAGGAAVVDVADRRSSLAVERVAVVVRRPRRAARRRRRRARRSRRCNGRVYNDTTVRPRLYLSGGGGQIVW